MHMPTRETNLGLLLQFFLYKGDTTEMSHYQLKLYVERHLLSFDDCVFNILNILSIVQTSTMPCGFKSVSLNANCIGSWGAMESQNGSDLCLDLRCFRQGVLILLELHLATVVHIELKKFS